LNDKQEGGIINYFRSEFNFITGNFRLLMVSWFIIDFFAELPGTYFPFFIKALGGSATGVGIVMSAEVLARALSQIPGGYIADKYGRKGIIVAMTMLAGISRVIFILAPSWQWLVIGSAIMGFTGIYVPAIEAMIADSIPSEKRGMGFGIVSLIGSVATTPSPLIAGFMYLRLGLLPTMRISYGLTLVGFIVASLIRLQLRETLETPEKLDLREIAGSYPRSVRESLNIWRIVPSKAFSLFMSKILTMFSIGVLIPVFSLYMVEELGISEFQLSLIMASMFITMIIFALPTGKLLDTMGKKRPLLASYVLWIIAMPLFLYGNFWLLIIAMTIVGVVQVLERSAGSAWTADLVNNEHRGRVNGSIGFFTLIAFSIGQVTGGWVYDNVSRSMPFYLQILLMIPPFIFVSRITEEKKSQT